MPNSATAKTKWAPKHRFLVVGGAAAAAAVLLLGLVWLFLRPAEYMLKAGNKHYAVEVANNDAERKRGLSGRPKVADNRGMLFVFSGPGKRCFWMKDMQFSIDIVWLNEQKQVVDLLDHVVPETYPYSFCPTKDAMYVLELNAGQIKAAGIAEGQTVSF